MQYISICEIQGSTLTSAYAKELVSTRGVVTGILRRGFFIQSHQQLWDGERSDGIFVYSPDWKPSLGVLLEVEGVVVDYCKHDRARPVTQIQYRTARVLDAQPHRVKPQEIRPRMIGLPRSGLTKLLNALEGMVVSLPVGCTFIAPSNAHGDYVLKLPGEPSNGLVESEHGGLIVDKANELCWFAGFRQENHNHAVRLNVGARLLEQVNGPLNYRADSFQIAVQGSFDFEPSYIPHSKSSLQPIDNHLTILTLNCFNLDPHIESPARVMDPRRDVDDDWGAGRFHTLAQAIVLQANLPDIVALQEIQDSDGAEVTEIVDASRTFDLLVATVEELSGIRYKWVNVNPVKGADGGQPGGNIRNGFLYNAGRVELREGSVRVFGGELDCFQDSRKPLVAVFKEISSGRELGCINLHLASKRHQQSIFAPENPGFDPKLSMRVAQAKVVRDVLRDWRAQGRNYYVTGDFNDTQSSETLKTLTADESVNLVELLPEKERYDYNHRGKLQVLMHGIVPKDKASRAEYEIIHGNELIGVDPGLESDKPSDHAYVVARISL